MDKGAFFTRSTTIRFGIALIIAITSSIYVYTLNDFFQPYISEQFTNLLFVVVIFLFLMKMLGFGKVQYMNTRNVFQVILQMTYEFRYPFLIVLVTVFMIHSIGKPSSLVEVVGEYHAGHTQERVLTIYNQVDKEIYDQDNKGYFLYNEDFKIKPENTYKIKYLKSSGIIIDIQGPLNVQANKQVEGVTLKNVNIKNKKAELKWEKFYFEGKEVKQYRIKTFVKKEDGQLLRSGSQIVVEDGKTSVSVPNLLNNREYRFIIEPQINDEFNEEKAATSDFFEVKE